ncbi:negative regulator of sexual conjugation and meiosis [Uncinocarpus reesii 1704]|uniref:Serine/threonine-protein kinase ATG1 n=1 Tax=Uncinocarpus reesii (strain UAMH 1704) TaxID=336963 RepID=C4JYX6_UNCRE|nr:negative regulator of sexual conjugation and meiosis [Uncinocarpus reesii 1704]EEP82512.1 negative regulator of sexual conjugation and meiosis [Uncinocarpus reesii 1704]
MLPTPPQSPPPVSFCDAPEDRLGLLLANRLELTAILGVGAYGVVYSAIDIQTHVSYAVKALNKSGLDPRQRKFQQREIKLHHMASHHPNVVSLVRILDSHDCTFVVLEFCPEGDLFSNITERNQFVGNDFLAKRAFLQILDAVDFCHSIGIYHRDLKPENILVSDHGMTVKLADFGLATTDSYTSDFGCGSTFYMSPECQQSNSTPYASAPNDVWSLGVILVNLCCGRNPWKKASPEDSTFNAYLKDREFLRTILPLSPELNSILKRIFDCDPLSRISLPELRKVVLECPRFTVRSGCNMPITPTSSCSSYDYAKAPFGYIPFNPYPPSPAEPIEAEYSSSAVSDTSLTDDDSSVSSSSSSEYAPPNSLNQFKFVPATIPPNYWGSFIPIIGDKPAVRQCHLEPLVAGEGEQQKSILLALPVDMVVIIPTYSWNSHDLDNESLCFVLNPTMDRSWNGLRLNTSSKRGIDIIHSSHDTF